MATAVRCFACKTELGAVHCLGCDVYFCEKDSKIHREKMYIEMDKIIEERNQLQDELNNRAQSNDQENSVIQQINRWEENIIEKVKLIAERTRQQIIKILNAKWMTINIEFKKFSQELARLKEAENYVEHDLKRLNQNINQFKQDLIHSTQSNTILFHTEQCDRINWENLIYVVDQQETIIKPKMWPMCRGRLCPKCGKCNDWYFDTINQCLKRRDGATCKHHGGPGGHSPYGPHYIVCTCKENN